MTTHPSWAEKPPLRTPFWTWSGISKRISDLTYQADWLLFQKPSTQQRGRNSILATRHLFVNAQIKHQRFVAVDNPRWDSRRNQRTWSGHSVHHHGNHYRPTEPRQSTNVAHCFQWLQWVYTPSYWLCDQVHSHRRCFPGHAPDHRSWRCWTTFPFARFFHFVDHNRLVHSRFPDTSGDILQHHEEESVPLHSEHVGGTVDRLWYSLEYSNVAS